MTDTATSTKPLARPSPGATAQTSMRLTERCLELADCMASDLGLSRTGIVEIAVREKAIRDGYLAAKSTEPSRKGVRVLAKTKDIRVEVRFKRSSEFQVAEFGLSAGIELEDGDDRQVVIDETRQELAQQVYDFCEAAIKRLVAAAK